MAKPADTPMTIGGGVSMPRSWYLAGFKEASKASYPTVPQLDVKSESTIDGNIDGVAEKFPELTPCLYNDVKICAKCAKPCAFTLTNCNACGASLEEVPLSKSENVFAAFLLGVKSAKRGFPYTISLRRETEDVLIFDDMLQLTPCHLNGISKKYYIPDWRFLLCDPSKALALLATLEAELWTASLPFLRDPAFRKGMYREGVSDEDIRKNVICSFNFPPSQFQLHVQWLVPPLVPFQHYMTECRNHFHEGRGFPMTYVKAVLELDKPYDVKKDTPIEEIMAYYKELGVDYQVYWTEWYEQLCLPSTLSFQNWNTDDFEYVVSEGKVYNYTVTEGKVELGELVEGADASKIQAMDKTAMQNYGRPYTDAGKPTGTYIQAPREPKVGPGGLEEWPGVAAAIGLMVLEEGRGDPDKGVKV